MNSAVGCVNIQIMVSNGNEMSRQENIDSGRVYGYWIIEYRNRNPHTSSRLPERHKRHEKRVLARKRRRIGRVECREFVIYPQRIVF